MVTFSRLATSMISAIMTVSPIESIMWWSSVHLDIRIVLLVFIHALIVGNFTQHKINYFKTYSSVLCSMFSMWHNHYLFKLPKHFVHSKRDLQTHSSVTLHLTPRNYPLVSVTKEWPILGVSKNEITQYVTCSVWFLSLSIIHISEFTLQNVSLLHSFPVVGNILLHILMTFCLSTHLLMNIWLFLPLGYC
jgi:hypothetical protein